MAIVNSLPPRATPRVTFSALVDVLASPAHRLLPILHQQKYPKPGPVFGYKKATEQLVDWFVNGTTPNPEAPSLRDHEVDALNSALALPGVPSSLLPAGTLVASVPTTEPTWTVEGVEVSFSPDLLISGTIGRKGVPATGAVKLYLRKDPTTVGPMLAALIYFHRSQIVGDNLAEPGLCGIVDIQAGIVHTATGNYQRLVNQVQQACQVIAAVWPGI